MNWPRALLGAFSCRKLVLMTSYRVEYTAMKPGGARERECDIVRGTLEDVRNYFDAQTIWAADPIIVVEHTQSDGNGRVVPTSEWDI